MGRDVALVMRRNGGIWPGTATALATIRYGMS
jgi:hypothetical protein